MSEPMSGLGLVPMETEVEKHTRRLRRLIAILEALPPERLDMSRWGRHPGDHEPTAVVDCGTSACAMGWAALDPEFQREGLSMTWQPVKERHDYTGEPTGTVQFYDGLIRLHGENRHGTDDIVRRFFGLTGDESEGEARLFWVTRYTRDDVLTVLRGLVVDRDELRAAAEETE